MTSPRTVTRVPSTERRRLLGGALLATITACGGGNAGNANSQVTATKWRRSADIAGGPRQECGVATLNGEVFVVGGFDAARTVVELVDAYDPATDTWRRAARMPMPLHHPNVASARGRLYIVGGLEQATFTAIGVTFEYDPAGDRWSAANGQPPGTQRGASAVAAIGDRIYVAGGARDGVAVTDFSAYDVVANVWHSLPALPVATEHTVGAAVDGLLYVIGGRAGGTLRDQVQIFDPAANRWTAGRPMPIARGGLMGAVVENRIHVIGGEGNRATASGIFDHHQAYDPAQDAWSTLEPMRTPRHGTGAASVDGVLYVPGGATVQGFGAVATHEAYVV
jgi:N-acetylneuraminic acid mutarotase